MKEVPFNSGSVVIVRGLVCADGLIAGSCLCDEIEGIPVLTQQGCGSIRRDGSCSKPCFPCVAPGAKGWDIC